jgi:LacI family transcriptional regulator
MVDVAKLAGVSISTVSHVLNGTRRVNPQTRRRVMKAIEETGYRQDALARAVRRSKSESIGLIVSDAGEPAFAEMVHGVENAVAKRGLTLLLANSAESAEREEAALRSLLDRRVDGLILARAAASAPTVLDRLRDGATPLVLLDRIYQDEPFDQVGAQNRQSTLSLVEHLHAAGHRCVAVVAGDTRVPTLAERVAGFEDAVRLLGMDPTMQATIAVSDEAEIQAALSHALRHQQVTAVVALSTPLAAAALRSLSALERNVGPDVAFATFDGFAYPDLFHPHLTTVHQPAFDMGVAAVAMIAARMENSDAPPQTLRLRQHVAFRESTADWAP